jgi:SAM-dependent methyltransferase
VPLSNSVLGAGINTAKRLLTRTQRAYGRVRAEGVGVFRDKLRQLQLPDEWTPLGTATVHFAGKVGVEVGGPTGIFRDGSLIPAYGLAARVDNCNFSGDTAWVQAQKAGATFLFDPRKPAGHQYFCEASALVPLPDGSYDFLLSSHCIEHLANPIGALVEWQRVLKPGGVLVLIVPHKDCTFDHRRPVTPLSHLLDDFERQMPETDMTHLPEVLQLHDLSKDAGTPDFATFRARSEANIENRCIHHHVFNTQLAVDAVDHAGYQVLNVQLLRPCHIVVLAQKVEPHARNNAAFKSDSGRPVWLSPLPSDQRNHW